MNLDDAGLLSLLHHPIGSNVQGANEMPSLRLTSITPLFGMVNDADVTTLTNDARITRATQEELQVLSADDVFLDHVRLYQPPHLLWKAVELSVENLISIGEPIRRVAAQCDLPTEADLVFRGDAADSPFAALVMPVAQLLRAFHLFKPGRFVAGDTSFFVRSQPVGCETLMLVRCSEMSIDYQFVQQFAPRYTFNSTEIPFFLTFLERLGSVWQIVDQYPQLDLAMHRYCTESARYGDPIELMISLEALLVPEEEGIAFRLAQRVANLIGPDAPARKELFKQIRDLYGLRSRIVHGSKLRPRELSAARQLDELREITRRVLLCVIALAADVDLSADSYASLLNDLCLDDDLRRSVQAKASKVLHC